MMTYSTSSSLVTSASQGRARAHGTYEVLVEGAYVDARGQDEVVPSKALRVPDVLDAAVEIRPRGTSSCS